MPKPRIQKTMPQAVRKPREGMSDSHLKMIGHLPCIVTGRTPVHGHHLLRTGEHGMGLKSSDQWLVPLASEIHDALHRSGDEDAFFADLGIDARSVARALWAARGDLAAMERVAFNSYQRASMAARRGDKT